MKSLVNKPQINNSDYKKITIDKISVSNAYEGVIENGEVK